MRVAELALRAGMKSDEIECGLASCDDPGRSPAPVRLVRPGAMMVRAVDVHALVVFTTANRDARY